MTKPVRTIALLADTLNSEYTQLLVSAVSQEANRRGLAVLTFAGGRLGAPIVVEASQNRIFDLVATPRIEGVISLSATLAHFRGAEGLSAVFSRYAPTPVVSIGIALPGIPSLVVDNVGGMAAGVRHLLEHHGRRRIAFIAGPRNSPESADRLAGYKQALMACDIQPVDELVEHGEFTLQSGREAVRRLLSRTAKFDAVVAANDYMALAAIEVLRSTGRSIPDDVAVCGFDDVNAAACATPSLTTLRQPLWELGGQAVRHLVDLWEGRTVAPCASTPLSLVVRESCGCEHCVPPSEPRRWQDAMILDRLRSRQGWVEARLKPLVQVPNEALPDWPSRVISAIVEELKAPGHFAPAFEQLLGDAHAVGVNLSEFQRVITEVRQSLQQLDQPDRDAIPEHVWHQARVQCCERAVQMLGRQRIQEQQTIALLGRSSERLATSLSTPRLCQVLAEELPVLGIQTAAISLLDNQAGPGALTSVLLLADGEVRESATPTLPLADLAPPEAFETSLANPSPDRIVLPLTFDSDFLGVAVLDMQCITSLYSAIRQQMGAALKGAHLHRQVVEQIAVRERVERERLLEGARLAAELQTRLNPSDPKVPGLEIAAKLLPAAEAGGDYYDIIPSSGDSTWIGIGDVTGHGLHAGLIMMMLQSIVSGIAKFDPKMSPSQLLIAANQALHDGIHHRLGRDDHATLVVMKYTRDGTFTYAGAHEPPIVHRAASGECELIEPLGFWVGAVPDIAPLTQDASFKLFDGDLLVLYTDGLVEPRNAHGEQFGTERLSALVKRWAELPVATIVERTLLAVREWTNDWTDDVTLLVLRYHAPEG